MVRYYFNIVFGIFKDNWNSIVDDNNAFSLENFNYYWMSHLTPCPGQYETTFPFTGNPKKMYKNSKKPCSEFMSCK